MTISLHDAVAKLDRYHDAAQVGLTASATQATIHLVEHWRRHSTDRWSEIVKAVCHPHPIFNLYQQCPMTRRCAEKPRGYAGDAVMLDYIYDRRVAMPEQPTTSDGEEVFRTVVSAPTCGSVDYRRTMLARHIDELAKRKSSLRVLSLACGHARELELCQSLANGRIAEVVALDQDALSLEVLQQRFAGLPVRSQNISVRDILSNRFEGQFDFVYSAGLYDYLDQRIATRLTTKLFDFVVPGGELLLANFHPDNHGTGYMEAFMDWWLIYRTDEEMKAVAQDIDNSQVAALNQFRDPFGNVTYLQVKRGS